MFIVAIYADELPWIGSATLLAPVSAKGAYLNIPEHP
jgi:hypothetical protein